jgi:O-antigen/teichoic acid export membrane protein
MTAETLIPAWVGPGFEESALVARILAVVIVLRVGNATASVILKGAGEHRMLAYNNAAVALANLGLSIAWIGRYGLAGVAFGTLIPVAGGTILNLWPRACRLAGIGAGEAFRSAVWPALWPLPFLIGTFIGVRAVLPDGVAAAMVSAAAGGICYAVVALGFGLTAGERALYAAKAERYFWTRKSLEATSVPSSRISIR